MSYNRKKTRATNVDNDNQSDISSITKNTSKTPQSVLANGDQSTTSSTTTSKTNRSRKTRRPFAFLRRKHKSAPEALGAQTPTSTGIGIGTSSPTSAFHSPNSIGIGTMPANRPKSRRDMRLDEFTQLMAQFPSADPKNTSLHIACQDGYSTDLIVEYVLKKDPDAAKKANSRGDLPLHCAMRAKKEVDDVDVDLNENQNVVFEEEEEVDGMVGIEDGVVQALLMEYPESVTIPNENGCLPVHLLCENGALNSKCFFSLARAYPESLKKTCELSVPFEDEAKEHIAVSDGSIKDETGIWCWLPYFLSTSDAGKGSKYDPGMESSLTPLHLCIMNCVSPEVVQFLLNMDQSCLLQKTDHGRTALDIAKYMVLNEVASEDNARSVKNTFAAIEIMQSVERNMQRKAKLIRTTTMKRDAMALHAKENFNAKKKWKKVQYAVAFTQFAKSMSNESDDGKLLGPEIEQDGEENVEAPEGFVPPENLEHVCVEIDLPVGFRRLRWALLSPQSNFLNKGLMEDKLNFKKIDSEPWNKCNGLIGDHTLPEETHNDFIDAERKVQYLMPKSGIVGANMAYSDNSIIQYSDYCIVLKAVTRNPDVPFGKTFSTHTQVVVINCGNQSCKMIASSAAVFEGKPPMIAWKIRNGVYNGTTDYYVAKGETICDHVS